MGSSVGDIDTVDVHTTVRRLLETGDHVEDRGLPCAVGSDEPGDVPAVSVDVHVLERHHAPEANGDSISLQQQRDPPPKERTARWLCPVVRCGRAGSRGRWRFGSPRHWGYD